MRTIFRRSQASERGQALIEFAFMLPLIALILIVLLDFGIMINRKDLLQNAVREGARTGAIGASLADIEEVVLERVPTSPENVDVTICYIDVDDNDTAGNAGDSVRVSAEYDYPFGLGGFWLTAIGIDRPTTTLRASADMRLEASVGAQTECP